MAAFPLLESLRIEKYGLYPGAGQNGVLEISLSAGPWIILGVNGLGKSTLLLLLKHLLTGRKQSIPAGFRGEERAEMGTINSRIFAMRVVDDAANATGVLICRFGQHRLTVTRRLSDLSLVEATVETNAEISCIEDENGYLETLAKLMGLLRSEDAIRVLDRIVFILEEGDPLVWDVAAQYEIFRALLTPETSGELRRLEAQIISSDSTARNLSAVMSKISKRREEETIKGSRAGDTRAQLAAANAELEIARKAEFDAQILIEKASQLRLDSRIELKRAEHAVDEAAQIYEKSKYDALRHAFAGVPLNHQYVLLKLASDKMCLVCGQTANQKADEMEAWLKQGRCLVCGSERDVGENVTKTTDFLKQEAVRCYAILQRTHTKLNEAEQRYRQAGERWEAATKVLTESRASIDQIEKRTRSLYRKLPKADRAELSREADRILSLREEVNRFRKERSDAENAISALIDGLRSAAEAIREKVEATFHARAKPFFAGQFRLVYAPRSARIGQVGRSFDFPAFEIEVSTAGPHGDFVKREPDQVSQSQREYLDIIFRMTLLEMLGEHGCSLVVDGPEGSVDAVFAERAGDLFASFARDTSRNAVLACNVVEGGLIPNALRDYPGKDERDLRIVDLLKEAVPTATLRQLMPEYRAKVASILSQPPTGSLG